MNSTATRIRANAPRPQLRTPWYAARRDADAARPQLHEYRSADFMQRFAADLAGHRLIAGAEQPWHLRNRLDGRAHPSLRQPIHDGYYLTCCELSCDGRSHAPLDPKRVLEAWAELHPQEAPPLPAALRLLPAGRRLLPEVPAGEGGVTALPIGRILSPATRGGDAAARIPLRPQLVKDAGGREHTLLSGYLPVSDLPNLAALGDDPLPQPGQLDDAARELAERFGRPAADPQRDHLLWRPDAVEPQLGVVDPRLGALIQLLDENLAIGVVDGRLAYTADLGGDADTVVTLNEWRDWLDEVHFYALPETDPNTLFYDRQGDYRVEYNRARAHIRAAVLPDTAPEALRQSVAALERALAENPVPARTPRVLDFDSRHHYSPGRIAGVTAAWLAHAGQLSERVKEARSAAAVNIPLLDLSVLRADLQRFEQSLAALRDAAEGLNAQFANPLRYRRETLLQWLQSGRADEDLDLVEQLPAQRRLIARGVWMARGPDLIARRWRMLVSALLSQWQGDAATTGRLLDEDRLYQVSVHARVRGQNGCEFLVHSSPSEPFHIASYHETRLMPPRPIRMPTLRNLRKAVSGAAAILPEDLADEVARLRFPDGEVKRSGPGVSGRWIYIFSIPIVTVCAMILLMLMINILNFIFRWIPYAILRIPFPR